MSQQPPPILDYRPPPPRQGVIPPGVSRAFASILGPLIGLLIVIAIFGIWRPSLFLTSGNFINVLRYNHHFVVAAVGTTFVIVTAGIDLSIGSVMALSCTVCAMVIQGVSFPQRSIGTSIGIGFAVALLVGPEGGWTDDERELARAAGWSAVSLGPLVLRAETAACAALAIVVATWAA